MLYAKGENALKRLKIKIFNIFFCRFCDIDTHTNYLVFRWNVKNKFIKVINMLNRLF